MDALVLARTGAGEFFNRAMIQNQAILWLLIVLSFAAFWLAVWMFWKTQRGATLVGCGNGSGCGEMLNGRWSRWMGIPITLPAAGIYGVVFVSSLLLATGNPKSSQVIMFDILVAAVFIAGGAAVWFSGLQLAIRRFCIYCVMLHAMGAMILIAVLWETNFFRSEFITPVSFWVAGLMLMTLFVGQFVVKPKLYVVNETLPAETNDANPLLPNPASDARKNNGRYVALLQGKVIIAVNDWPLLGKPDAPHVLAYLYDYTCEVCRQNRVILRRVLPSEGSDVAVIMVPAPVNRSCNPHIHHDHPLHQNACQYARLGLMVWQANPILFQRYEDWVMQGDQPPPIRVAQNYAEQLLGLNLDPNAADAETNQRIVEAVALFQIAGQQGMPALLFPGAIVRGLVPSAIRLTQIMAEQSILMPTSAKAAH